MGLVRCCYNLNGLFTKEKFVHNFFRIKQLVYAKEEQKNDRLKNKRSLGKLFTIYANRLRIQFSIRFFHLSI